MNDYNRIKKYRDNSSSSDTWVERCVASKVQTRHTIVKKEAT